MSMNRQARPETPAVPSLQARLKRYLHRRAALIRTLRAPRYSAPTQAENRRIESSLRANGIAVSDYSPDPANYSAFCKRFSFPEDYLANYPSTVHDEKRVEHFVAYELLGLRDFQPSDLYVDIAACASPWADMLRNAKVAAAQAIDLAISPKFIGLPNYHAMDATHTDFASASVRGASLQCAYEMFCGQDDVLLLAELGRILAPGARCVIAPLYLHTHFCGYSTAEHFRHGHADPGAKEYVRRDSWNVPYSRKYDAEQLLNRVIKPAERHGLAARVLVLKHLDQLADGLYCHFILELVRQPTQPQT